jgi:multiple sugar transport system substrate-binding protein
VDNGRVAITSPQTIQALNLYKNLSQYAGAGVASSCESDQVAQFTAGKAAMILDGSWQQDTMKQSARFDWRIAAPPAPAGKSFVGALGGWNLAINKKSGNQDAAWKFVEFLSQPDNQMAVNSLIPALRATGEQFVKRNRKQPEVILQTLNSGQPRPISPVYPQLSEVQQRMAQAILSGTPVEQAAAEAKSKMESVMQQNP